MKQETGGSVVRVLRGVSFFLLSGKGGEELRWEKRKATQDNLDVKMYENSHELDWKW